MSETQNTQINILSLYGIGQVSDKLSRAITTIDSSVQVRSRYAVHPDQAANYLLVIKPQVVICNLNAWSRPGAHKDEPAMDWRYLAPLIKRTIGHHGLVMFIRKPCEILHQQDIDEARRWFGDDRMVLKDIDAAWDHDLVRRQGWLNISDIRAWLEAYLERSR